MRFAATSPRALGQLAFAAQFDEVQSWPVEAASEFDSGITAIYAFWPYRDVPVNTPIKAAWFHDGEIFARDEETFDRPQGIYRIQNSREDGVVAVAPRHDRVLSLRTK